jgi:hypothetical protein
MPFERRGFKRHAITVTSVRSNAVEIIRSASAAEMKSFYAAIEMRK